MSILEDQLRPLVQAELSVLVDVLHRPELLFPMGTDARQKCESGGFISKWVWQLCAMFILSLKSCPENQINYLIIAFIHVHPFGSVFQPEFVSKINYDNRKWHDTPPLQNSRLQGRGHMTSLQAECVHVFNSTEKCALPPAMMSHSCYVLQKAFGQIWGTSHSGFWSKIFFWMLFWFFVLF